MWQEVAEKIKKRGGIIELGAMVDSLVLDNNMLKKISVPNGSDCFDGTLTDHQHLVCIKCGEVSDICIPELSVIEKKFLIKQDSV